MSIADRINAAVAGLPINERPSFDPALNHWTGRPIENTNPWLSKGTVPYVDEDQDPLSAPVDQLRKMFTPSEKADEADAAFGKAFARTLRINNDDTPSPSLADELAKLQYSGTPSLSKAVDAGWNEEIPTSLAKREPLTGEEKLRDYIVRSIGDDVFPDAEALAKWEECRDADRAIQIRTVGKTIKLEECPLYKQANKIQPDRISSVFTVDVPAAAFGIKAVPRVGAPATPSAVDKAAVPEQFRHLISNMEEIA